VAEETNAPWLDSCSSAVHSSMIPICLFSSFRFSVTALVIAACSWVA
jgi:hypothetical protein